MSFAETIIIKSLLLDKAFLASVASSVEVSYLSSPAAADIYGTILNYFNNYNDIPPQDIIINEIEDADRQERARDFLNEVNSIDFDVARQYDYLIDKTDEWLKEKAMKQAILKSVDLIDDRDYGSIRHNIETALGKTIKLKLGLDYFGTLRERINRIREFSDNRLPTYYPVFDEYLNGGFPPYTLSVIVAAIHRFKSNTLANFIARQVLAGHNIALLTLEMSEDAFAQRFDSILSCMDINKIYRGDENIIELYRKLRRITQRDTLGKLYIKEFPTGEATVLDYKAYIRELLIRGIKLDALYVDYINLMKPSYGAKHDLYVDVKRIAEELRALGFVFNIPIISVSQLNRPGTLTDFRDVSFSYIAESMGIPATADFIAIYGVNEDKLVYENEIHYKIEKNRLGGRVGEVDQFFYDSRSLKMYDSSEETLWIDEATLSQDRRSLHGVGGNGDEE
jgi:replicative DNA helicase